MTTANSTANAAVIATCEAAKPSIRAQWMWGNANILGSALARANPMRWSAKKSIADTIVDLKQCCAEDMSRPVLMEIAGHMEPGGHEEVTFANVEQAIAELQFFL